MQPRKNSWRKPPRKLPWGWKRSVSRKIHISIENIQLFQKEEKVKIEDCWTPGRPQAQLRPSGNYSIPGEKAACAALDQRD